MTDYPEAPRAGSTRHGAGAAFLTTALLLAGCAHNPEVPYGSKLRIYANDVAGGAKICQPSKVTPIANSSTDATIRTVNDGGWCGFLVHQEGPAPYGAGLLTTRPVKGTVTIHEVGDDTRIDYTPDKGFAGRDTFVVKLLPGDAIVYVTVAVSLPQT